MDNFPHVVQAQSVLGNRVAQRALVMGLPFLGTTLEIRKVFLSNFDRVFLVRGEDVDHTIGDLKRHRPDFLGCVDSESTTFNHCRTTHRHGRSFGCNDDVTTRNQGRVTSKRASVNHRNHRHESRELRKLRERVGIERDARSGPVIPRSATSSLAKKDQRNPESMC